jgi:hypothetical protein
MNRALALLALVGLLWFWSATKPPPAPPPPSPPPVAEKVHEPPPPPPPTPGPGQPVTEEYFQHLKMLRDEGTHVIVHCMIEIKKLAI